MSPPSIFVHLDQPKKKRKEERMSYHMPITSVMPNRSPDNVSSAKTIVSCQHTCVCVCLTILEKLSHVAIICISSLTVYKPYKHIRDYVHIITTSDTFSKILACAIIYTKQNSSMLPIFSNQNMEKHGQ